MVQNTRTDKGDGWRRGLFACPSLLLAQHLLSATLSIPGRDKTSWGSKSPWVSQDKTVGVKTQTDTPAVLLGHFTVRARTRKNPRETLNLRKKATRLVLEWHRLLIHTSLQDRG